jgi:hypothetical protein
MISPAQLAAIRELWLTSCGSLRENVALAIKLANQVPALLAALEEQARELERVRTLAAVLCKAINEDEENGIDADTTRALVALRLAILRTGEVNAIARAALAGGEEG